MSAADRSIDDRRRELIARSDAQREEIAGILGSWSKGLGRVDAALGIAKALKLGWLWRSARVALQILSFARRV